VRDRDGGEVGTNIMDGRSPATPADSQVEKQETQSLWDQQAVDHLPGI
jgi:hypothetical protein